MEYAEVNFKIAEIAGVNAAIVLDVIMRRIVAVKADGIHYRHGRCWTRVSMQKLAEGLPFLSIAAVRTAIRKLKEASLITVKNFNATPYDHTAWYALTGKAEEIIRSSACRPENVLY